MFPEHNRTLQWASLISSECVHMLTFFFFFFFFSGELAGSAELLLCDWIPARCVSGSWPLCCPSCTGASTPHSSEWGKDNITFFSNSCFLSPGRWVDSFSLMKDRCIVGNRDLTLRYLIVWLVCVVLPRRSRLSIFRVQPHLLSLSSSLSSLSSLYVCVCESVAAG